MNTIFSAVYFLLIVPGAIHFVIFVLILALLTLIKKLKGHRVQASLIATGVSLLFLNYNAPYWVLINFLITSTGVFTWSRPKSFQKISVLIATLILFFGNYMMAEVEVFFPTQATWEIGDRGKLESGNPEERLVELRFGDNFDQLVGKYSDELADYLIERGQPEVSVKVPIYYIWGKAHSMGVVLIDGKKFKTNGGGYASWSAEKEGAPFPKYYFGLKGFSD